MGYKRHHIIYCLFFLIGILQGGIALAQNTIAYDITTVTDYRRVFLFNTRLRADSASLYNKAGKKLTQDEVYANNNPHKNAPYFTLFEAQGSALIMDTAGYLFILDNENIDAKPKPLNINIDTVGGGKKNVIIECRDNNQDNVKIFVVPYAQYRVSDAEPNVRSQLSLRIDEIVYGAKGKLPPRLLDAWRDQITFIPENRKILYEYTLLLPQAMVNRKGTTILMIYDLSNQVVAIVPNLNKEVNVIKRDNIITNTYIYKLFFNDEEIKKGLIHFLSPEDEQKKQEAGKPPPPPKDTPKEGE